jgi:hypothetical protein
MLARFLGVLDAALDGIGAQHKQGVHGIRFAVDGVVRHGARWHHAEIFKCLPGTVSKQAGFSCRITRAGRCILSGYALVFISPLMPASCWLSSCLSERR